MYDFIKFIESLNNNPKSLKDSLELIKDDFHIGRLEIKSSDSLDYLDIIIGNYDKVIIDYYNEGYKYSIYRNGDNYIYSEAEINDLNALLRIISLHHKNYVSEKKLSEGELLSFNTKLLNTHGFIKRLKEISSEVNTQNYNSYFINLKGFGLINRVYSNEIGDNAIIYYANRLKEFALSDEVVGHPGGDNFVAFIKRERHEQFVKEMSNISVNLNINNKKASLNLIGIIGYYEIDDKNLDLRNLLTKSSVACQYARATKKNIIKLTPELYDAVISIKNIENSFREELKNGNFIVYYQPKFDIVSGKIVGVEALSRWINKGKVVPPVMFVPILEKNGEIIDLDLFILENLCKAIHNFRNQGHSIVPASCNLSRKDFENPDLEERIINIIKKYNVKTEDIVIEVTETTNLEENARLAKFIDVMWENGIMTSIDDFGTGYSSLSVLRDFKVNEIKIDRSFINKEELTNSDEIIIGSIIDMAKKLNIDVICEGVETKKQLNFLLKLGCFKAQGFYYSKPLPKEEFEEMLLRIGSIYE